MEPKKPTLNESAHRIQIKMTRLVEIHQQILTFFNDPRALTSL